MGLNSDGFLLEGVRVSNANSPFTFPPRSVVTSQTALDASKGRAEYVVFVAGQDPSRPGLEIADPALTFRWTRNNGTVMRFGWDGFARRWSPSPGGGQEVIGTVTNSPRIVVPIPDPSVTALESPYVLYVGSPDRLVTFNVELVGTSGDFTDPPAGRIQVAVDSGEANFGTADLSDQAVSGKPLYVSRQSFFDRTQVKGRVGSLPASSVSAYGLWLNPIPGSGQAPIVRVGFGPGLVGVPVSTDAGLSPPPPPGQFKFSLSTGRLSFSPSDIDANAGVSVYYDGVILGSFQLVRGTVGLPVSSWPNPVSAVPEFVGVSDPLRFIMFTEPPGLPRQYFFTLIVDADILSDGPPPDGTAYVRASDGTVYVSGSDPAVHSGVMIRFVDSVHMVEDGVSVQFFRSGLNGSGEETVSDFVELYTVPSQTIVDGIGMSPFVQLPTVPLVDSFTGYRLDPGSSGGSLVGPLVNADDSSKPGYGYGLELEDRRLKFYRRKTVDIVLERPSPAFKLPDAAINPRGLVMFKDGSRVYPGVDFDFNKDAGVVEFIEPVGENDPGNVVGASGTATAPNRFDLPPGSFSGPQDGKFLFIKSGVNLGVYRVSSSVGTSTVFVNGTLLSDSPAPADIRAQFEVIADRFWAPFRPPFKKLKVYRAPGVSGPFSQMSGIEFSVIPSTSQVNLTVPARPGEVFRVESVSLDSTDEGVTVNPVNRTEFAGFRVRQEQGTVVPSTGTVLFNPDGRTVAADRPMTIYVDGVTVPPDAFTFESPGRLTLNTVLTSSNNVMLSYFVYESLGGDVSFNLKNRPLDVDFPEITAGDEETVFNGVQPALMPGSAILIDGKTVVIVKSSVYDPASDVTNVSFNPAPYASSERAPLQVTGSVTGDYSVVEPGPVDVLVQNTNTLSVSGNSPYPAGTIVFVDGDPYLVVSSSFVQSTGRTNVILAENARKNYIMPSVTRTVRPVFGPGREFRTEKPAHSGYPMTFVRTGTVKAVLRPGTDYNAGEGGIVTLAFDPAFGDSIGVFYVARKDQPSGTSFSVNYSSQVAPSSSNGILGQRLVTQYRLYNPDSFYFRKESVKSFIPEVIKELASSSGGSSGPNTASVVSFQTKDYGLPSLYFEEQHLRNLDFVVSRLLQYFNDQVNSYEDVLANIDGRVVGGSSGRFRFNGDLSGVLRASYADVKNDIDDQVKLYDRVILTGYVSFGSRAVYGAMWDYNPMSRLYGTARSSVPAAFNDKVVPILDYGKTLGSIGIGSVGVGNIGSIGLFRTARSRSKYMSVNSTRKVLTIAGPNGDAARLIPPFFVGQRVKAYLPDGTSGPSAIVTAVSIDLPFKLTLDTAVSTLQGAVMADNSSPSFPSVRYYQVGKHVSVDMDVGQVKNSQLPPPFGPTDVMAGNEVMEVDVTFLNSDMTPKRIPALDGLELRDDGTVSFPPLTYSNELDALTRELEADSLIATGVLSGPSTVTSCPLPVIVGQTVMFTSGPNAGLPRVVQTVGSLTFTTTTPFPAVDAVERDISSTSYSGSVQSIAELFAKIISTNVAMGAVAPAVIGTLDSELEAIGKIVLGIGSTILSRTTGAVTASDTLADPGAGYLTTVPPVSSSCFLYVPSGSNRGLYKVKTVHASYVTVDPTSPFPSFASIGSSGDPYFIIQPWSFVTPRQAAFATEFIQKAVEWLDKTAVWASSTTAAGRAGRVVDVNARMSDVRRYVSTVQALLRRSEKLYDLRYLWIKQRTDRREGLVVRIGQAASRRSEALAKLLSDQEKSLVASRLGA